MRTLHRRGRVAAVLALLGAGATTVVVLAGIGTAAPLAAPRNTSPPTISGTTSVGSTLTANRGQWTGTDPITYTFQWVRCDENGGSCANIGGANENTYVLKNPDADNTIRVRVTARNADGTAQATSVPSAVVKKAPTPPATGCPPGTGTIAISDLSSPARLNVDRIEVSPSPVGGSTQQLTARVHVTACGGRNVQGALVYITTVPFNQWSIPPEPQTGGDGWTSANLTRLRGFPAAKSQQLLVFFVRARKSGEDVLAGVSNRRLLSVPVRLSS
jgi:hypothetical protein